MPAAIFISTGCDISGTGNGGGDDPHAIAPVPTAPVAVDVPSIDVAVDVACDVPVSIDVDVPAPVDVDVPVPVDAATGTGMADGMAAAASMHASTTPGVGRCQKSHRPREEHSAAYQHCE